MDPRDLARGNGVSFSVGPLYTNAPYTNWGVPSGPSFVITLDPQVNVGPVNLRNEGEYDAGLLKKNRRRRLMSALASEFAVLREDLLRELAR